MKLFTALCILGAASAAKTTFKTNSYKHTEEREFPLNRPGHVRRSPQPCLEQADPNSRMSKLHLASEKEKNRADMRAAGLSPISSAFESDLPCVDGKAGDYSCNNIDLLSYIPLAELGTSREASDSWGWTDPDTGTEVAIIVFEDSTAFVQVDDPINPVVLGNLPQSGPSNRIWADVKVFANHAYIIREVNHGVQVIDLTTLREFYNQTSTHVRTLTEETVYREQGITSSHNIVINEETAFAYAVGTTTCRGGLHAIDISEPKEPTFAGCFSDDGYTHDAQVVIYNGPDSRYVGREIAFNLNENTLTIVDVSDKGNMTQLSRTPYTRNMYTHQGWLTEDHAYLISNDELDETYGSGDQQYTRTLLWDLSSLTAPVLTHEHIADVKSIDHNLYIKEGKAYLANYCSGLRILDATQVADAIIPEIAYFDMVPYCNSVSFNGAWSNYPYFESGTIVVSVIEKGLYLLKHNA